MTVCPISSRLISRAISRPNATSSSSRRVSFRPAIKPAGRQAIVEKRSRGQERDVGARQLVTDGGEDGFRVAPFQSREQKQRFPIRPQVEEILRRDLPGHDCVSDSGVPETRDQLAQLADSHPVDFIHFAGQAIVGFIGERGGHDSFHSGAAGSISEQARINSVAGDDSERVWNFHEARLTV